jgi:hypothetical protein
VTGQSVRVFGRLLDANAAPITGAGIALSARSDAGVPHNLGSVATDSTGRWSVIVRPRVNQTYLATFAGDGTNEGTHSGARRVVANARVTIHGSASAEALTVHGRVAPNKSGETVRLVGVDRSGHVHHLGHRFLDRRSRYHFHRGLPDPRWRLQVRIRATGGNGAGRSSYLVVSG